MLQAFGRCSGKGLGDRLPRPRATWLGEGAGGRAILQGRKDRTPESGTSEVTADLRGVFRRILGGMLQRTFVCSAACCKGLLLSRWILTGTFQRIFPKDSHLSELSGVRSLLPPTSLWSEGLSGAATSGLPGSAGKASFRNLASSDSWCRDELLLRRSMVVACHIAACALSTSKLTAYFFTGSR